MKVYPVPGFFLADQPAVEHDCTEKRCVESGAFTRDKPKPPPIQAVQADTEAPEIPGPSDSSEE